MLNTTFDYYILFLLIMGMAILNYLPSYTKKKNKKEVTIPYIIPIEKGATVKMTSWYPSQEYLLPTSPVEQINHEISQRIELKRQYHIWKENNHRLFGAS